MANGLTELTLTFLKLQTVFFCKYTADATRTLRFNDDSNLLALDCQLN